MADDDKDGVLQDTRSIDRSSEHRILWYAQASLVLVLCLVLMFCGSPIELFRFQHSSRGAVGSLKDIGNSYSTNKNSSEAALESLLNSAYERGMCYPVLYGGSLQWSGDDVSPLCNCIRNMHMEYSSFVMANGTDDTKMMSR